jgi:hypothetical protein
MISCNIFSYRSHSYTSHISSQRILHKPCGMFMPLAAHVATAVSNAQANRVFSLCFLLPHIIASITVATPFKMKNNPTRIRPSRERIGCNAYIWKMLMRPNAPMTPMGRAMTIGTPHFGSPYLSGQYARDVQGDEKALCHVSDLLYRQHMR